MINDNTGVSDTDRTGWLPWASVALPVNLARDSVADLRDQWH